MPTPLINTLSPRQQSYIADLARQRSAESLAPHLNLIAQAAAGTLSRNLASELIDALTAIPRMTSQMATATAEPGADDIVIRPSYKTRAGRMLQAGGIEATVTMPNGQHVTIRVSTRAPRGRGWANVGPTDEGARTNISVLGRKVGWVNVDAEGRWVVTLRTRNVAIKDAVRVMFDYAAGNVDADGNMGAYRVQESSRCGRCFRQLTDPVSIDRGIGPECYGRTTGSHHVAVERNVTAQPAERNANGLMGSATTPAEERAAHDAAESQRRIRENAPTFRRETIEAARAFGEAARAVTGAAERSAAAMTDIAEALPVEAPMDAEVQAARDLIVEALDAYESGVTAGMNALRVFDQLVAKVAARS